MFDNRIKEVDEFLKLIADIDFSDSSCWPPGASFVAGFGVTMAEACKKYINENRHSLTGTAEETMDSAEGWR